MAKQFKFMAEQELQKQKRDDDLYLQRKREDLYVKMYDLLMRLEKDIRIRKNTYISDETKDLLNIIQVESIWGNQKTMDKFYDLIEEFYKSAPVYKKNFDKIAEKNNKKILAFQELIRKELGVLGVKERLIVNTTNQ